MSSVNLTLDKYIEILPLVKKWKEQEYRALFWAHKWPKNVNEMIDSAAFQYSSITRERMYYLIENMDLNRVDTCTTIVSISDEAGKSILCGFVYSELSLNNPYFADENADNNPHWMIYSDGILTKYLNIGPSLDSVDGEYRSEFSDMNGLYKFKKHQSVMYNSILNYLKSNNATRKYTLNRETFFPNTMLKKHEPALDQHFIRHDVVTNMYMMVWYVGMYNKLTNIREDHVNERYLEFIDKHGDDDVNFFKSLIADHGKAVVELVYRYINNASLPGYENTTVLGLGQKLTPLNLLEVQNPFDVRFVPWRDYLVSQALAKLAANNICPGFALINAWAYVKSSKKGLFNNKIQYQKIERSDQARAIIDLLVQSKSFTYKNIKESSIKQTKGTVTEMLSNKFKILHDQIDEAVNFGKNEIIMSNVSFLTVGEYTGRTWNDSVRLAKSSPYYNESIGRPFTSEGYKYFRKYIFDICYNLHCMFEKFGIIHGDLHLNNLTLYQKFPIDYMDFEKVKNPHVLYAVGDENTDSEYYFALPSLAYHTTLIDFGRCFIHPKNLESIRDTSLSGRYEATGNLPIFIKEQTHRLVRTYIKTVPSAADQEQELKLLFTKNFDAMYKLMSVIDLYSFLTKLHMLFSLDRKDVVSPHSNCTYMMQKMIDICSLYLISDVSKLVENKSYIEVIEARRSPLLEIMLKIFSDNILDEKQVDESITLIDVYVYKRPLTYSASSLGNMPEVFKTQKYEKDGEIVHISSVGHNIRTKMREEYENKVSRDMDVVDLIGRRHKEKLF